MNRNHLETGCSRRGLRRGYSVRNDRSQCRCKSKCGGRAAVVKVQSHGPAGHAPESQSCRRYRPAPSYHQHRGGDDGEPLLRQHPGDAEGAGGRVREEQARSAPRFESLARDERRHSTVRERSRTGIPHAQPMPGGPLPLQYLGRLLDVVCRREDGRFREEPERPGLHGVLHAIGDAVRQLVGHHVPRVRPLLLLGGCTDLPQPALPDGGYVAGPSHRHLSIRPPPERDCVRGADGPRHPVEELLLVVALHSDLELPK